MKKQKQQKQKQGQKPQGQRPQGQPNQNKVKKTHPQAKVQKGKPQGRVIKPNQQAKPAPAVPVAQKKRIKKGKDGKAVIVKKKAVKFEKKEDRDLDRELRDYWVNQKGKNNPEGKELAKQKLDS